MKLLTPTELEHELRDIGAKRTSVWSVTVGSFLPAAFMCEVIGVSVGPGHTQLTLT